MASKILATVKGLSIGDWLALTISFIGYLAIGYLFPRSNFAGIFSCFVIAFLALLYLYSHQKNQKDKLLIFILAGVTFRLVFLFATPALSDDYKRFLWDGELLHQGINPYSHKPSEVALSEEQFNPDWHELVLSKDYYTVYPPLMQASFYLASVFPFDHQKVIILRLIIILLDILSIVLLMRLLPLFKLPKENALLYALNPLPIIEFAGNLHFEAGMITLTLLAFYVFKKNKYLFSGLALSGAFLFKLLPIIFIPGFIKWPIQKKHWLLLLTFILPVLASIYLIGIPGVLNLFESLRLYFRTFEFNASIYYLVRWIGFQYEGYNVIQEVAPILTVFSGLVMIFLAFYQFFKSFSTPFHYFTLVLTSYFLLSTTINPWYIAPILAFGLFTNWVYPIVWSFLVFLSYHAFSGLTTKENTWVLFLEYGLLFLAFGFDYLKKKSFYK